MKKPQGRSASALAFAFSVVVLATLLIYGRDEPGWAFWPLIGLYIFLASANAWVFLRAPK